MISNGDKRCGPARQQTFVKLAKDAMPVSYHHTVDFLSAHSDTPQNWVALGIHMFTDRPFLSFACLRNALFCFTKNGILTSSQDRHSPDLRSIVPMVEFMGTVCMLALYHRWVPGSRYQSQLTESPA
jgi:hypothetical protein